MREGQRCEQCRRREKAGPAVGVMSPAGQEGAPGVVRLRVRR